MDLNYVIRDKFGVILKQARHDANVSQEELARRIGVSKKTVQNWEDGLNCPKLDTTFVIFSKLTLQPQPYFLQALFEEHFEGISPDVSDKEVEDALIEYVKNITPKSQRKLLYLAYGDHGSSPQAVLEMMTAHLHTPLRDRINIAQSIENNYLIALAKDDIVGKDHVQPNMKLLSESIQQGKDSVIKGIENYSILMKEEWD